MCRFIWLIPNPYRIISGASDSIRTRPFTLKFRWNPFQQSQIHSGIPRPQVPNTKQVSQPQWNRPGSNFKSQCLPLLDYCQARSAGIPIPLRLSCLCQPLASLFTLTFEIFHRLEFLRFQSPRPPRSKVSPSHIHTHLTSIALKATATHDLRFIHR